MRTERPGRAPTRQHDERRRGLQAAFDLVLGSLGLAAASPILAGVFLAIRLSGDRGPIVYRASRVGEGGRIITVLKIRTMVVNTKGPRLTGAR